MWFVYEIFGWGVTENTDAPFLRKRPHWGFPNVKTELNNNKNTWQDTYGPRTKPLLLADRHQTSPEQQKRLNKHQTNIEHTPNTEGTNTKLRT